MIAGPDLATCSEPYWRAYLRGYSLGHVAGYEQHLAEVDAADNAMFSEAVRLAQATARQPRYSQLCDRRGEPERAARARAHERWLGLAP